MRTDPDSYLTLEPEWTDPAHLRREREKARKLRKSQWWLRKVNAGVCHYCERRFKPGELTMDHIVPLARGGRTAPGNVVPACLACNREKKLRIPAEEWLADGAV